ncbi:hypothetical protein KFE25_001814 [Diacronema lutheri]|uniref:Uncharacterized protein n=1 Tax=Diacronema lutheri TaxID=2081491 RepID=A0A8J6C9J2_DIALT|nr:hypothetical protein KFE25_001814 [Diacronema lutheri]
MAPSGTVSTRALACALACALAGPRAAALRPAAHGVWRVAARVPASSPVRRIRAANPLDEEGEFERYEVLRNVLDGMAHPVEVNELVSLLLGYGGCTPYVEPERALAWQVEFPACPDVFADESDAFSWLESDIPDDPEQLDAMRVLFEAMYGEEAVRMAQKSGDPEYLRRSTIVTWIVLTTRYWSQVVSKPPEPD